MLLGVERTRNAAHESFAHSISGTDLVVGPRTSPVQLMLYAVFRIGEATSNMKWTSYQELAQNPDVAWTIPLSIGDSHHGFPVVGTTAAYFEHYRYGLSQPLKFAAGQRFENLFDAVLGAEVAERMRLQGRRPHHAEPRHGGIRRRAFRQAVHRRRGAGAHRAHPWTAAST